MAVKQMRKPEVTSKRVAAIAGRALRALSAMDEYSQKHCGVWFDDSSGTHYIIGFAELKSLAASALTQRPDKPKRGRRG